MKSGNTRPLGAGIEEKTKNQSPFIEGELKPGPVQLKLISWGGTSLSLAMGTFEAKQWVRFQSR